MTEAHVRALFLLSGFEISKLYKIQNEYRACENDPWWLVKTKFGLIKIGWRTRVINIDWEDTGMRLKEKHLEGRLWEGLFTSDDVTQGECGVHAWGYSKAVEYLQKLKSRLEQFEYFSSDEGKQDLAAREVKADCA